MRIAVVLGNRLAPNGSITKAFRKRLEKGLELLETGRVDRVIITGGATRLAYPSEARVAYLEVPMHLRPHVRMEEEALSTVQNAMYVNRMLVDEDAAVVVVITSNCHVQRARFWFDMRCVHVNAPIEYVGVSGASLADLMLEPLRYAVTFILGDALATSKRRYRTT